MTNRKVIDTFGRKRRPNYVRILAETVAGVRYVRVQWKDRDTGKVKTESWDDTRKGHAEARAFAEELHAQLSAPAVKDPPPAITLRSLWSKYQAANEDALAATGFKTTAWRWRKFELFAKPDTLATDVTLETMDGFKRRMLEIGHSVNQVSMALTVVRMVIRWGVVRDLLAATKVTEYRAKFSKAIRLSAPKMAEYSREEATKIVAQFDPRHVRQWRPWVLVVLLAYCGPRVNAALHLAWPDIDFAAGTIHWRAEHDKVGTDRVQPAPPSVLEALWVAYGWRTWSGYTGQYVFFGVQRRTRGQPLTHDTQRSRARESMDGVTVKEKPWSYAAFIKALHEAADVAKVPRLKFRGAHGFRRLVSGDVFEATGSSKRAAQFIGDRDTRLVERRYIKDRPEELREIAEKIGGGKE